MKIIPEGITEDMTKKCRSEEEEENEFESGNAHANVQLADFGVIRNQSFLDTHPYSKEAMSAFEEYHRAAAGSQRSL